MTRELCIMACVFCRDPVFQKWSSQQAPAQISDQQLPKGAASHELNAKAFILSECKISSRNELDTNPEAAQRFHDQIRKPYLAWREQQ
jgi:hypothetical protein